MMLDFQLLPKLLFYLDKANDESGDSDGLQLVSGGGEDLLQVEEDSIDAGKLLKQHQRQSHQKRLHINTLKMIKYEFFSFI